MPTAQNFWIYYQLIVVVGTIVVALSNVVFAAAVWRFVKVALPEIKKMRDALDVLKYDTLKRMVEIRKKQLAERVNKS